MTAEFREIFNQQQQTIKDLTERVLLRDDEIRDLKTRVTHRETQKEATDEEMNNLYK